MSDIANFGYNLGSINVELYLSVENLNNVRKEDLLLQLQTQNGRLKDISKLISAMTERKAAGKANFNGEPEYMDLIDRIREDNKDPQTGQSILPSHQYDWNDERTIDIALQGLNDQVKIIGQEVNQITMYIQQQYQDMHSIAEIARKSCEDIIAGIQSIQRRTGN